MSPGRSPHILIGVTACIAGYKICNLISRLRKKRYTVSVILTPHAKRMWGTGIFERSLGGRVHVDLFPASYSSRDVLSQRRVVHIELADAAVVAVLAPAGANCIGKLAHGIADDLLTTVFLATRAPILLAPSMNTHMWENVFVQENIRRLTEQGMTIIPPDSGLLACGYDGVGRLARLSLIEDAIEKTLHVRRLLSGKRVLVTAGGTMEPIDGVRVITNRGSGKMGRAIADAASRMGARVLLLRSASSVLSSGSVEEVVFETGEDLRTLLCAHVPSADILFHTAAVCDFHPQKEWNGKLDSTKSVHLTFTPCQKILSQVKTWNPDLFCIAFKAVWGGGRIPIELEAKKILATQSADVVIANDVSRRDIGFVSDENEAWIIRGDSSRLLKKTSKRALAYHILRTLFQTHKQ